MAITKWNLEEELTSERMNQMADEIDNGLDAHKADNMTQKTVHGLRYEEGAFTPELRFGGNNTGITYSSQLGRYVKIGKLVNIEIDIVLTSKGAATGFATIMGLPFSANVSLPRRNLSLNDMENITIDKGDTNFAYASCRLSPSATAIAPVIFRKNGTNTGYTDVDFSNTTILRISGNYHTN